MPLSPAPARRLRENLLLAVPLSAIAGMVNSVGFLRLGAFTSHVTGAATNLGSALGGRTSAPAYEFAVLLGAFLAGSFAAGLLVEAARMLGRARYALGLAVEACLLAGFIGVGSDENSRLVGLVLLCLAMGLQNALATSVSAAAVRATHLTGLMTDMGLEAAHFLIERNQHRSVPKLTTQAVTLSGFLAGAIAGAVGELRFGKLSLLGAIALLIALTIFDAITYQRHLRRAPPSSGTGVDMVS
jgi:uncharacterized membrane protein YoaK (UPF0700 family)